MSGLTKLQRDTAQAIAADWITDVCGRADELNELKARAESATGDELAQVGEDADQWLCRNFLDSALVTNEADYSSNLARRGLDIAFWAWSEDGLVEKMHEARVEDPELVDYVIVDLSEFALGERLYHASLSKGCALHISWQELLELIEQAGHAGPTLSPRGGNDEAIVVSSDTVFAYSGHGVGANELLTVRQWRNGQFEDVLCKGWLEIKSRHGDDIRTIADLKAYLAKSANGGAS